MYIFHSCVNPEGGLGFFDPIDFLRNTGPDPLENDKSTQTILMLDHHRSTFSFILFFLLFLTLASIEK